MRTRLTVLALCAALALAGCSSLLEGPPTPEPFQLPPSPTVAASPTAETLTVTPEAGVTPTAIAGTTIAVERGDVVQTLSFQGEVVAPQRRPLGFAQAGQLKDLKIAGPGKVSRGQLLAELDTTDLDEQVAAAQAEFDRAKDAATRAEQAVDLPVRRANVDVASAQDALAQARRPATPEQLTVARAVVQRAEANLARVRNDASAVKSRAELAFQQAEKALLAAQAEYGAAAQAYEADDDDAGTVARYNAAGTALREAEQDYKQAKIDFDTALGNEIALVKDAEADIAEAQAALEQLRSLPDPFAVKQAERAVEMAQIALAEARARAVVDPEPQARLEQARKALSEINTQLEARRLYAPADGEIAEILVQAGVGLQAGDTVMIFLDPSLPADTREIWVSQVGDAANLQVGQDAAISFMRYSDRVVAGKLARIVTDAASGLSMVQISYDGGAVQTDPGDAAMVAIELARRVNVLWLPPSAVQNDGTRFVIVRDGGDDRRAEVEVGIEADARVEIVSGLTEGQTVVLP